MFFFLDLSPSPKRGLLGLSVPLGRGLCVSPSGSLSVSAEGWEGSCIPGLLAGGGSHCHPFPWGGGACAAQPSPPRDSGFWHQLGCHPVPTSCPAGTFRESSPSHHLIAAGISASGTQTSCLTPAACPAQPAQAPGCPAQLPILQPSTGVCSAPTCCPDSF